MKKRYSGLSLALSCMGGVLLAVIIIIGTFAYRFGSLDALSHAVKFASVYCAIDKDFVGDADMEEVSNAAYSAMVQDTKDRWSYYMTAEQYAQYQQYQNNSYTGIGVTIEKDSVSGLYKIVTVEADSPAQRAGVKAGDLLSAINGSSLAGVSSDDIKKQIAGFKSDFELTLRAQDGTERNVKISTELVYTKPVSYEMLDNKIGYIKVKNFESDSGEEINSAVDELVKNGAKGIVFDVRNNPGGLLSELMKALDHILPEGDIFVSVDKAGKENVKTSDASCVKLPMAVLINENSYSAAEFFGAALSEYNWAALVGTHTTGKARSQINIELTDGSAVHLSTNSYLTPKRIDLAKTGGLKPDIEVNLDSGDETNLIAGLLDHDKDGQLKSAVSYVNEHIDK